MRRERRRKEVIGKNGRNQEYGRKRKEEKERRE
jgi:hypothetical protein